MKTLLMIVFVFVQTNLLIGKVHIILFYCSGSFIGKNAPEILRTGSLKIISQLINSATYKDTIIFFPIRNNSTLSSLEQTTLVKQRAKKVSILYSQGQ